MTSIWQRNLNWMFANISNLNAASSVTSMKCTLLIKKVRGFVKDTFIKGWKRDLFNDGTLGKKKKKKKLRSYRTYKDSFGLEDYLYICKNANIRQEVSKFRLSSVN